jgi:hypothetical protein
VLLAIGQFLACSEPVRQAEVRLSSRLSERFRFDEPEARWVIQSGEPFNILRCTEAVAKVRYCIGKSGEIWRDGPPKATRVAQWSVENFTDIWRRDNLVLLLGESGSVYELDTLTSRLVRGNIPRAPWNKTLRVNSTLFALDTLETLFRSTDNGVSWSRVPQSPEGLVEFATDPLGRMALLAVPERLYVSTDGGDSFFEPKGGTVGALGLGNDAKGAIRLYSLWEEPSRVFPLYVSESEALGSRKLNYAVADYLSAEDYVEGRVAEGPGASLVLRKSDSGWEGFRGRIGEPLDGPFPVTGLPCAALRLMATKTRVFALCSHESKRSSPSRLTLWESPYDPLKFERVSTNLSGDISLIRGLGRRYYDELLLSGICLDDERENALVRSEKTQRLRSNAKDCDANTIYRVYYEENPRSAPKKSLRFEPLQLVPLTRPASAIAESENGKILVIAATDAKSSQSTLFVSTGHLERFSMFPLHFTKPPSARRALTEPIQRFLSTVDPEVRPTIQEITVTDDGMMTLVVKNGDRPTLLSLDADGSPRAIASAPLGVSQLGANSEGALALSISESRIYESTNQGADFLPIATLPHQKICASRYCSVVCREKACVLGRDLARIGFGPGDALRVPFEIPMFPKREVPRHRRGYACRIGASGWQELKGEGALPNAMTAGFVSTGVYWLGRTQDGKNATLARARRGSTRFETESVLSKPHPKTSPAVAQWRTQEGWVVGRVANPGPPGSAIGDVDFRWENLRLGTAAHARVHFDEPLGAQMAHTSSGSIFTPASLSLSSGALLVELGGGTSKSDVMTRMISERGVVRTLLFPRWPVTDDTSVDYLSYQGSVFRVAFDKSGRVAFLATEGASTPNALTVLGPQPLHRKQVATFGSLGEEVGVFLPGTKPRFLAVAPPTATDKIQYQVYPLPTLDGLVPCSEEHRRKGTRIVVPESDEWGPSVRVELGDGSLVWLEGGRYVVYQNGADTCFEALEARDEEGRHSSIIWGEPSAHHWLFRQSTDPVSGASVLYASLDCEAKETLEMGTR